MIEFKRSASAYSILDIKNKLDKEGISRYGRVLLVNKQYIKKVISCFNQNSISADMLKRILKNKYGLWMGFEIFLLDSIKTNNIVFICEDDLFERTKDDQGK